MDTIGNQIAWRLGYLNILQGVIARLAMVAASYEMEATDPDAEVYD